jgi:hypothetical protein
VRSIVGAEAIVVIPVEEHEFAHRVGQDRQAGLLVVLLAVPEVLKVALGSGIEAGPLEGSLSPVPLGVLPGPKLED